MQRDMDLVRAILLTIEEHPEARLQEQPTIEGRDNKEVGYHLELLNEAGLIAADGPHIFDGGRQWTTIALTWQGHEFLDAARDDSRWQKAKARLGGALNNVTLAVLKEVLVSLARSAAGLP